MLSVVHQFRPPDDPTDDGDKTASALGGFPHEGEDLPYRVEVWDETGAFVEQVVAVSLSPSIGYAAYYAATAEFPARAITLRHKAHVISRWIGRAH
jgi:hypothetical protein